MPTVVLSPLGGAGEQFFDNNGNVLSGGKIYTYAAGTTTPLTTYTSVSGGTAHANPIILDSAGRVSSSGSIWLIFGASYKFVLKSSADVTIGTWDNITGTPVALQIAATIAAMSALTGMSDGERVLVTDTGFYRYSSASTATVNGASVASASGGVGRWLLEVDGAYWRPFFHAGEYGMVADGTGSGGGTDNYTAMQALWAAVQAAGKGTIYIPPGVYYIGQYRITGGASQNAIANFILTSCSGVEIVGYGAKIDMKGNFNRADDGPSTTSYENGCVISFTTCSNVAVRGLEIDGNCDQTTKAVGVTETSEGLLQFAGCTDVTVEDCYLHHGQCDGMTVNSSGSTNSKRFKVSRTRHYANARNGGSFIGLFMSLFEECYYANSGLTNAAGTAVGALGSYSPEDGVDVEPIRSVAAGTLDIDTGELTFLRCQFSGSIGSQWATASDTHRVSSCALDGCYVDSTGGASWGVIMACDDGRISNCTLDMVTGEVYPVWGTVNNTFTHMHGNLITATSGSGVIVDASSGIVNQRVIIENNRMISSATSSPTGFPYLLDARATIFRNNYIYMPRGAHDGTTFDIVSFVQNALEASGNTWDTDLVDPALWFAVSYSGTERVSDENHYNGVGYTARSAWASGRSDPAGIYRTNAGLTYRLMTAGAGTTADAPVQTSGEVTGADGYAWAYVTGGTYWGIGVLNPRTITQANHDPKEAPWGTGGVTSNVLELLLDSSGNNHILVKLANNAEPVTGTWVRGSIALNFNPGAGGVTQWTATTGGVALDNTIGTDGGIWTGANTYAVGAILGNAAATRRVYRVVTSGGGAANVGAAVAPTNTSGVSAVDAAGYAYEYVAPQAVFAAGPRLPLDGSATWNPGSIADGDMEAKDITVTGAALGDFAQVSFSLDVTDLTLTGTVTATDTVTAVLANNTGGAVDLGSGTVYARVNKR